MSQRATTFSALQQSRSLFPLLLLPTPMKPMLSFSFGDLALRICVHSPRAHTPSPAAVVCLKKSRRLVWRFTRRLLVKKKDGSSDPFDTRRRRARGREAGGSTKRSQYDTRGGAVKTGTS